MTDCKFCRTLALRKWFFFISLLSLIFIIIFIYKFSLEYNLQQTSAHKNKQKTEFSSIETVKKSFTKYLKKEENVKSAYEQKILETIKIHNRNQVVRNLESFGPITDDTIVILIQADKRIMYFQALIDSLGDSKYINNTLLVVSHGYYNDEMVEAVEAINFTRVVQIFFPYSLQTHPNSFPGLSPGDCPLDIPKLPKCFGKQRNLRVIQIKHHWWWKINFVFNHLRIIRNFEGLVLFLEEDHYVFPDVLHVLKHMKYLSITKCAGCNMFGLGQNPYNEIISWSKRSHEVSIQQWNNMGFAFTREFWRGLNQPRCKNMFCEYNDYNWDFTLAYLSHQCLPKEIKPLIVVSSRVFHIGDCGVHHINKECDESLKTARNLQRKVAGKLFPPYLIMTNKNFYQEKVDAHNGGWDDPRDIQLCKNISQDML